MHQNVNNTLFQKLQNSFFLISGPCVIENEELVLQIAETVALICKKYKIPYIFKASFDKANRTSLRSFRGLGIEKGLETLLKVKRRYSLPILTDIHEVWQAEIVKEVVDIIQIPAFLSRQTDLLLAAACTQKIVNVKKAQFSEAKDMKYCIDKIISTGNKNILLTERGNCFGYHNLVVDMRNLVGLKKFSYPVIMDVTHSTQKPSEGAVSGGQPEYIPTLARAAASVGIGGLFIETHPTPAQALSDGSNMLPLHLLESVIVPALKIYQLVDTFPRL